MRRQVPREEQIPKVPGGCRGSLEGMLCSLESLFFPSVSAGHTSSSVGFLKLLSFLKKLCLSLGEVWRKQFSIFLQFSKLLLPV